MEKEEKERGDEDEVLGTAHVHLTWRMSQQCRRV